MSQKRAFGKEDNYDSDFEDDDEDKKHSKVRRQDLAQKRPGEAGPSKAASGVSGGALPSKGSFEVERARADSFKGSFLGLNAFERHKKLINEYFLYYPGSKKLLQRDGSRDKNDRDIIQDHHRFIWNDSDDADTWEKQLSKKYYDKLFKEYCISDLSFYKMGKFAMRWRTEAEVVNGKGQFICGGRKCENSEGIRSWEVNFAYMEESVKKNALVKLRLCPDCSTKLNFNQKRKDVTKIPKKKRKRSSKHSSSKKGANESCNRGDETDAQEMDSGKQVSDADRPSDNIWKEPVQVADVKSREEEFDDYLDDLFL